MTRFAIRRGLLAALAGLALMASALPAAHAQAAKKVRLGHSFTDSHPRAVAMKRFAEEVGKATHGAVRIEVYGSSQLGSEEKMLIAVQSGVQELYLGALSPIAVRKKQLQIFDFPFLFASGAEAAHVLDGPVGRKLLDSLGDMNMQGLTWSGGAFRDMSNSRRPIQTLEDMKGLKVRVMQNPMALASLKAMGINAVPMAFTEVYPALEIKALDGYEHPVVDMYANKMYEVQKYLTITRHVYTPVALVASSKWWNSLTPDQRGIVQKVAEDTRAFERELELKEAAVVVQALKDKGMTVAEMPPAELQKIRAAVQPVVDQAAKDIGPDFVQGVYAEIDAYRKRP
ncbi:MAG: DctP family TRAP transporter solute-binding subunit [Comamonas sp.]